MKFTRQAEHAIAEFRGLPRNASSAVVRQAIPLDNLMSVLVEEYKLNEVSFTGELAHHWPDIVGPQYAARCTPLKLDKRKQVLLVGVENPTLRQELYFNKREILKRLHTLPEGGQVKDVKFLSG